MSDKLLLDNMLLVLKSTVEVYVHGSLESSNKPIHNVLKHNLDEIIKLQDELYNKMTEYGWYTIENVETKKVKQSLKKLQQNTN